ncbi:MAG: Type VI secretion system, TssC, VipB [Bacteriophage sp.]|nr:MAG: Type VI secretion system, TssC, VipB [Bacteriophage sp.]UWI08471.1 MAG: Type VI secretion system, TssC, VipB [Bacteriophage sp.]
MGLPDIVIEFTKKAVSTIAVGTGGLVGIIIKDAKSNGSHVLKSVDSIPADLTADNKAYIERAFLGAPKAVHVFVLPAAAEDYTAAYKYFANKRINYICGDPAITKELATNLSTWVKGKRKAGKIHPVAVVPNVVANDKGTVNFCLVGGEKLSVGDTQYTPAQYCSRIAGLLAGLDLNVSATYKPLDEVTAIPEVEDDETVDAAIDAGQLVLYDSGTGIVIGRGVNSLTTVTQEDTEDLKKIKILAIQDLITTDITDTINKSYVGNYSNSYDNKCLLITAIKGYLTQLENKGYIEKDKSVMEINVEKQRAYLESTGVDTTEMDDQAVKEANTGSRVFLKGSVSILDAIEDVDIVINKE